MVPERERCNPTEVRMEPSGPLGSAVDSWIELRSGLSDTETVVAMCNVTMSL
jgi:hypothetical protein